MSTLGENPYRAFVEEYAAAVARGAEQPLGGLAGAPDGSASPGRTLMHFSPHPDDEGLVGALPLRLMRDAGMRVLNVPVTFGSKEARRAERVRELEAACAYIGFELCHMREGGFVSISPKGRDSDPGNWAEAVSAAADVLREHRPVIILVPHRGEFNPTHQGTHDLVVAALEQQEDASYEPYFIEWEYWTPLDKPNLLLEVSRADLATLIAEVSFHAGEVTRNPQHVNMPAWMQDTVRRGAELVGSPGATAPEYEFGMIYRVRAWQGGQLREGTEQGWFVGVSDDLRDVLPGAFAE